MSGKYGIDHLKVLVLFVVRLINIISNDITTGWNWLKELSMLMGLIPAAIAAIANIGPARPEIADLQPDERDALIQLVEVNLHLKTTKAQAITEDALEIIRRILDFLDKLRS